MYSLLRKYYLILALVALPGSVFSQATITGAEYFWDTDPGVGNASAMVASDGSYEEAIEAALETALASPPVGGLHLFNVRFQDSDGDWGPVFKRTIATEDAPRDIKITLAEYFWDTDPGEGAGTAMVAFDGAFDEAVETALQSALTTPAQGGLHLFNIRVQDENGAWGPVFKRTIATEDSPRDIKIQLAEYFWDTDPGEGSGTAMLAFDGAFDEAVETALESALTTPAQGGLHLFHIRVQDENGDWGPLFKRTIATEATPRDIKITLAEFFWDTDPGEGSGTAMIAFDGAFDEAIETVLYSALTTPAQGGLHLFNIRVRDDQNNWGPVFKRTVATEDTPRDIKVSLAEYFWNTDPGEGSGTAMVAFDGAFDEAIETALETALSTPAQGGLNLFNVRVQDENGDWGPVFKRTVFTEDSPRDIKVTGAEYFWGLTDPGEGNGTAMVAFDGAFDEAIESAFSNGLNSPGIGLALYNVRVQDENGDWGPLFKRTVYIEIPGEFLEIVALNPTDSICLGDSVQLVASGLVNYSWSPGSSLSATTGDTVWASPTTTTTYTVNADDGAGTTEVDSITITVIPPPVASISGLDPIYCTTASPVTMTGTPAGGTFSGTGVTGNTFDPATAGLGTHSITYTVANAFGCTDDTTITVTVNDLSSSATINPVACDSYVSPEGNTYTTSGTYIDVIPNAVGCDSTITINLTVNASSTSSITETICASYTAPSGAVFTSSGVYTDTIPNAAGCDSVITINLTIVNASATTLNETACEGYTLNAQTYTSSGTYIQTLTNAAGCDSTITLNLVINYNTSATISESACDSYTAPSGAVYNSSGAYTDVIPNAAGCDSTITINLTITTAPTNTMVVSECESYTLNGQTYTSSGTYTQTLSGAASNGCDSIIVLNLIINNATSSSITESSCDTYTAPSGAVYTSSGTYTDVITNAVGCDSIITINLTITNGGFNIITDVACDAYTLNGQTYTSSGSYTQTLAGASANGCDSTLFLNLIINNSTASTINETACDAYTSPSGAVFTLSGTYTDIIPNAAGCDSVISINLTINSNAASTITDVACDSYTLNGQTYTSSGSYTQTLVGAAANGCDSIITLNLIINTGSSSVLNETACGSYTLNGQTYTASGTYFQQLTNSAGCDSTITLNLTISPNGTNVITDLACDSYTLNGQTYTVSGTYEQTIAGAAANGCDSVITLNLIINSSNTGVDAITACGSYTWIDGNTYTSSNNTATWTTTNAAGCDSVITLDLTIDQPAVSNMTEVACDSYTLNDQTYTTSGTYTQTLAGAGANGCDSVIILNLLVNATTSSTINEVTCGSYTAPSGATYTASGTYTDIIPNVGGCDSVITINLTVNSTAVNNMVVAECDNYTLNGQTYISSGTYTQGFSGLAANGCDSIIVLNLIINNTTASTISPTACDSYTAPSGAVYSVSGTYTDVILNAAGCDSIITINLTINGSSLNNMTASACDSYTLNGQTYTSTGSYTQNLPGAASNGCDSTIILDLTITGSSFATITQAACDSYTINGNTYTTSGTYVETLAGASANGCDSIVTVSLTILNATFNTITDAACDIYTLNGQTYTSSGVYTQSLTNAAGCDSTITLNLTINYTTGTTLTEAACNSYTLNAQTYTSSGTYTQTLTNAAGCDSVITLNLTIGTLNTSATINEVACDLYTAPSGTVYTSTGTYTDIIPNASGCDSVITINLTLNTGTASVLNEFSCGGYTMNGQTYTSSGTYVQVITNAAGCDSTITLNLTVGSPSSATLTVEECDSYTLNAQTYTSSGTYVQVLTNAAGCDSTITLNLTINNTVNMINEVACGSYTLNGQTYASSGTYTQLLPGAGVNGCDSTIMINLTVNPVDNVVVDTAACNSFTMNGQTYTSSGMYVQNLTNAYGCDSIVTLDLTIGTSNSFATITEVACDLYTAPSGFVFTSSGTYVDVIQNASGCDSIITINLTVNSGTSSTIVADDCSAYILNGQTYSATGVYTQVITNSVGCDSTITLDLTINSTDTTLTAVGCNTYTLNGITYTSSGIYTQTLINAAGCDSIITLDVTIGTQPSSSIITEVACDTYISPSGMMYTSSGVYTDIIPNAAGCDSVITINLTVNSSSATTLNEIVCDAYTLNGITYVNSGTYTQTVVNAAGCDSTITLNLTVNSNDSLMTVASCNMYTLNGITYTSSGTYTQVLTNNAGCDSTIILDLTIGTQSSSSTITEVACDTYTSPSGLVLTSSGVYNDTIPNAVGCDSIISIILTVSYSSAASDVITACDTYTWIDGNTYTSSNNTATYTTTNAAGCDSTINLDLTINSSTSSTVTATATDSYTMNGQTYTQSGIYTQVIPNAVGCDSTITLDLTVGYTGLDEDDEIWVSIYPNPTYGKLTLQGLETLESINSIYITDTRGRLVKVFEPDASEMDISDLIIGMYHLHIKHDKGIENLKVMKQ